MFDVLVIGGGMAGTLAALSARADGARVALAARSHGATALSTGALDIAYAPALSATVQMPRTIVEHVMDIAAHRQRHPYAVLGLEQTIVGLRRGFAMLAEHLAGTGLEPGDLDLEAENRYLPSSLGVAMPAAAALAPHRGLDLAHAAGQRWGVVQLLGDASFAAGRVMRGLAADAAALADRGPELIELGVRVTARGGPLATARAFDDVALIDEVTAELRGRVAGLDGIIFPPVLGLGHQREAHARLQAALGLPLVEALAHVPSVPGVRLQRALAAALSGAGVASVGEVVRCQTDGRRVVAAMTADRLELHAASFVLASGRFIAGGVLFEGGGREALFGLPLVSEDGLLEQDHPLPVVRETPMESHPLMTAGVQVNDRLQPMCEGRPPFDNLFAAGMVIGGFASRYALCADGVALCTGYLAGKAAASQRGGR